jgi:hypothetical protein
MNSSRPLVHEADLDLAVPDLLHEVVELVRRLGEHLRVAECLAPRSAARHDAGANRSSIRSRGVRPRDLEDVEVRIELVRDRARVAIVRSSRRKRAGR